MEEVLCEVIGQWAIFIVINQLIARCLRTPLRYWLYSNNISRNVLCQKEKNILYFENTINEPLYVVE